MNRRLDESSMAAGAKGGRHVDPALPVTAPGERTSGSGAAAWGRAEDVMQVVRAALQEESLAQQPARWVAGVGLASRQVLAAHQLLPVRPAAPRLTCTRSRLGPRPSLAPLHGTWRSSVRGTSAGNNTEGVTPLKGTQPHYNSSHRAYRQCLIQRCCEGSF
jgi:hypothetical protein